VVSFIGTILLGMPLLNHQSVFFSFQFNCVEETKLIHVQTSRIFCYLARMILYLIVKVLL
jgi:hypothetical protein